MTDWKPFPPKLLLAVIFITAIESKWTKINPSDWFLRQWVKIPSNLQPLWTLHLSSHLLHTTLCYSMCGTVYHPATRLDFVNHPCDILQISYACFQDPSTLYDLLASVQLKHPLKSPEIYAILNYTELGLNTPKMPKPSFLPIYFLWSAQVH